MSVKQFSLVIFILLIGGSWASAQQNILTAGVQFKPIFPSAMLGTGPQELVMDGVNFKIDPRAGFAAGMVVRRGITPRLSFETGINYVRRKYDLTISDSAFTGDSDFRIVGYEIPAMGLVFIQLAQQLHMTTGLGVSLDIFPSDIFTSDTYFRHLAVKRNWLLPGLQANLGYEWRTEKKGFFYLGGSYHQPFSSIFGSSIKYNQFDRKTEAKANLKGNYLTVDLRYFFHEEPLAPKTKTERKKKK